MAAATMTPEPAVSAAVVDHTVDLHEIDWEGFQTILRLRGDRSAPRISYLDGTVTLMSPSMRHETASWRLGQFVVEVAAGHGLTYHGIGSTTLGREVLKAVVEGDQAFYLANVERIRGKTELDLNVDPPPDLAIEAVVSHGPKKALEIYRRLGVPEVWVGMIDRLRFFRLGDDRAYRETPESLAFPFLTSAEVFEQIDQPASLIDSEWQVQLRAWVVDVLSPRVRGGGAGNR